MPKKEAKFVARTSWRCDFCGSSCNTQEEMLACVTSHVRRPPPPLEKAPSKPPPPSGKGKGKGGSEAPTGDASTAPAGSSN